MRRVLIGAAIVLASISASAAPPPTSDAPLVVQGVIPFEKYGALRGFKCMVRRTTQPPEAWAEMKECDQALSLTSATLISSVTFAPESAAYDIDVNTSCSALYWLSIDNGATFRRIALASWTPGQFQTVVVPFAMPIELPAGSAVVQRLQVTMYGGRINQGCNLTIRPIGFTR
jgi:hypothetical protein